MVRKIILKELQRYASIRFALRRFESVRDSGSEVENYCNCSLNSYKTVTIGSAVPYMPFISFIDVTSYIMDSSVGLG